ncbi:hypothetical protein GCM10008995_29350 [Halobellus salinus]|uniref:DNA primase/polymerase bifunctional N-terminal domain-containing protein n=1 Tax=Halobellus salinus TaxID=931585 RepID=A0A830ERS5_9EURY|nr:bifunctional DNA primase/polymerase [Halobellus salinus]GGJ17705.1 hypothetical protein GCM10008995_29350 [Halobellus salinus]
MKRIPDQIRSYPLVRVCRPDCRSHNDCNHPGKRPVSSVKNPRPVQEVRNWVRTGGNYGVVPTEDNDLIILDSDSDLFTEIVTEQLPQTFSVRTGSGNYHFYYRSKVNENQSFKAGEDEFGSVRANRWHCVGPGSVHPETGEDYAISVNSELSVLTEDSYAEFTETVESRISGDYAVKTGGGGGGSLHGQKASELNTEPTEETLRVLGFINSDSRREEVAKVIDSDHPPRNTRVWASGFLYSVCGLTQKQIEKLLRETAVWATDSERTETEIRSLVRSSTNNSRASESVNLSKFLTADMDPEGSERRKTEESGSGRTLPGGENSMEYNTIENLTVYNADSVEEAEDGDRVIRVELTNMSGRGDDGEPVDTDFVTITKGTLRENGDFGVAPEFPGQSKSVGSADPDDLRLIASGLEEVADSIEE